MAPCSGPGAFTESIDDMKETWRANQLLFVGCFLFAVSGPLQNIHKSHGFPRYFEDLMLGHPILHGHRRRDPKDEGSSFIWPIVI